MRYTLDKGILSKKAGFFLIFLLCAVTVSAQNVIYDNFESGGYSGWWKEESPYYVVIDNNSYVNDTSSLQIDGITGAPVEVTRRNISGLNVTRYYNLSFVVYWDNDIQYQAFGTASSDGYGTSANRILYCINNPWHQITCNGQLVHTISANDKHNYRFQFDNTTESILVYVNGVYTGDNLSYLNTKPFGEFFFGVGHTITGTEVYLDNFIVQDETVVTVNDWPNLIVKAYDYEDNSTVTNFTVRLENMTNFTTTNGTVIIGNTTADTYTYNVTYNDYFNVTNNVSTTLVLNNTDYTELVYPWAAEIKFRGFQALTNFSVGEANFSIGGVTNTTNQTFYLKANGTRTVDFYKLGSDYLNTTQSLTVSALDNRTVHLYNLYDGAIYVHVFNNWSQEWVNNFDATIQQSTYGYWNTTSTTNGTVIFTGIIQGINYTVNASPDLSQYNPPPSSANIYLNTSTYNQTFNVTPFNSVNFTFRYYNDTLIVGEMINLTIINSVEAFTNNTTTGYYEVDLLSPDNYELRTESAPFLDRKYFFVVTNQSTQTVDVYLTLNTSTELQVFRVLDTTNQEVTGAVLRVYRETTAGSNLWTNYAEEITNAEGKTNVYLEKGINNYYRFAVSVNGSAKQIYPSLAYYTSKTNFISGVSETVEIVVLLDSTTTTDYYSDLYGVVTDMGFIGNDTVYYTWLDAQNTISGATLIIKGKYLDNSTTYETISVDSSTATSGNLTYNFTVINDTIYQIYGYINYSSYDIITDTETKSYGIDVVVDKNTGLLFSVIILVVAALITIYLGVLLSAVLTIAMLVFTNLVGFTDFPTTVITSLLALAIILLINYSKKDDD